MKTFIALCVGLLMAFTASAQITVTAPDTVSWGDTVCIVVNNHNNTVVLDHENITDGSWSDSDTLSQGGHLLCPTQECPGLNEYRLEWYDSTGNLWLGDTIVSIYWISPYAISADTVTATSWQFTVTTTIPLRILLKDAGMTTIDSAIVTAPGGTVSWQGLQPQSTYHRIVYPDGGSVWGCDQRSIMTDTLTTSISDLTISSSVRVTSERIVSEDSNDLIELYDMSGQLVRSGRQKVELDGLSAGIYFYRIYDAEGTILSRGKFPKL